MESRTNLIQDNQGNASSSRLIGMVIIIVALMGYISTYVFAFIHSDMALAIIGVSSGAFITVTTPTFYFLYNQKKTEVDKELKQQSIENDCIDPTVTTN